MTKPAIEISHLSFGYENQNILQIDHLQIEKNSFVGIIGPNGGGKTTLLKLLMGFLEPSRGKIQIFQKKPSSYRLQMGYVPQVHKCDKEFPITVQDLILLGAIHPSSFFGKIPQETKERAQELLHILGLEKHKEKPFGSLSGGLAQRALFARAILCQPKLLFLDEPTANVDPESTQIILNQLKTLQPTTTILMVTHDFNTITKNVSQILCIQGSVSVLPINQICNHFSFGLYHSAPNLKKD